MDTWKAHQAEVSIGWFKHAIDCHTNEGIFSNITSEKLKNSFSIIKDDLIYNIYLCTFQFRINYYNQQLSI